MGPSGRRAGGLSGWRTAAWMLPLLSRQMAFCPAPAVRHSLLQARPTLSPPGRVRVCVQQQPSKPWLLGGHGALFRRKSRLANRRGQRAHGWHPPSAHSRWDYFMIAASWLSHRLSSYLRWLRILSPPSSHARPPKKAPLGGCSAHLRSALCTASCRRRDAAMRFVTRVA